MCSARIALVFSCSIVSSALITSSLSFLSPVLPSSFAANLVSRACAAIAAHVAVPSVWLFLGLVDVFSHVFFRSFSVFFMYVAMFSGFYWRKVYVVRVKFLKVTRCISWITFLAVEALLLRLSLACFPFDILESAVACVFIGGLGDWALGVVC